MAGRGSRWSFGCTCAGMVLVAFVREVKAQTPATLSGPPVQVQPYAPEPGVPLITINPGTPNPFAGATDPTAAGGGSTDSGAAVAATGVSGGGSSSYTGDGSAALGTML